MTTSIKSFLIEAIKKGKKINEEFLNSLSVQQLTVLSDKLSNT